MLTADVKNKINTARNILVGKIPDPKGQIDQITNALIYKFMDDQDRLSQSVGGNASFFINDLEDFAWHTLFDAKLSNQDRANLYIEGIEKLSKALHLPKLFQDIFKDAFLPFRASDTIAMFLDCLNGFDYAHSEELGNAFEYLLSIMGSQGNAGQFRTPRHIIEFLVDAVDPQKTETILDPACGTAGFLVEAYTHIVQNNQLSAQDKQSLSTNIFGVDIDPGMAKIARVNLYLHGFKTPNITEDDTLTNEKLWEKKYDVILANPPFMTPKGGIVPHDKFEISANRSEVLFVDYIAEHLKLNGRAGIIVPEGIIFQSANAYKALRKKLVEDWGLCAVISLPSGVFQPYSGVKTSILILDRKKASETDTVLFVKIENDGFDLGAQRREIAKNDLPKALEILKEWQNVGAKNLLPEAYSKLAFAVTKKEIAQNGEWNLTGERYKEVKKYDNAKFPMVELGEILSLEYGKSLPQKDRIVGLFPVMGSNGISGYHNNFLIEGPSIIVGRKGSAGEIVWINENNFPIDTTYYVQLKNKEITDFKFIYFILKKLELQNLKGGAGIPGLNRNDVYSIKIPLPPLEIQEKIVAEIEQYQKIIDGAKQVVQNWKPSIKISPEWEMVELGEVCEVYNGSTPKRTENEYWENGEIPWFTIEDIREQGRIIKYTKQKITEKGFKNSSVKLLPKNSVLLCCTASVGEFAFTEIEITTNQQFNGLVVKDKNILNSKYLFWQASTLKSELEKMSGKATFGFVSIGTLKKIKIPLPPLEIQEKIVAEIEAEQNAVEECKKLIAVYEKKIEAKIGEVWGE